MDLGVDLGTSNVVVYADGKGIVLREPSVVAVDRNTGKVLQVGAAARNMLGRTPGNVVAMHPLQNGVVNDYEMTEKMLALFFKKAIHHAFLKPRVVVSVPSSISEVEERAVINAAMEAGARRVYLIEAPLAAALGANLDIEQPEGRMVVDIGGGTTDVAVLTMDGIAMSSSTKAAGDAFDEAIIRYARVKHNIRIGQTTAEEAKITVGCVYARPEDVGMLVKGRDMQTGLPKEFALNSSEVLSALKRPARQITDEVVSVLERISPELMTDISRNGIVLTGGGCQIYGMDKLIQERTGISVTLADDADSCVAYGCGKSLINLNSMQEGPINLARHKLMRD